ncbi:unnamed protein product [Moneuplotes crassus]|uniref:Uncharacterized protein n=1 Tax=Euplotes crassus TaxID=5936 RepID=A0AAD1XMT9_EUPCR|nr:unnamed protein product [Moneuplotes crassus]
MLSLICSLNNLLAWVIGIYTFTHTICMIVRMGLRNYARKPLDLQKRYGKGSWVIVTGATGGIGEQYCVQFAKEGFNVVLIGRNKEKLEETEIKVKEASGSVKTKVVVADLGETVEVGFYQKIYDQVKDLDVSILVNNAGWGECCHFEDISLDWHLSNLRVNAGAPTMLTHNLINHFLSRKTRSALINVSTIGNNAPLPYMGIYCAAKRFLTIFSYYLTDNYGDKIDIQNLTPGFVSTKIVNNYNGPDSITPEKCVKSSLRDLGQEFTCLPVPAHSLTAQMFHTLYRYSKPLYRMLLVNDLEKRSLKKYYKDNKE